MTNEAFELLKLYSKRDTISLKGLGAIYNSDPIRWSHPVAYLKNENYLEILPTYVELHGSDFTMDAPFRITYKGRTALDLEIKSRRHVSFNELRAWLTLLIAFAAFFKSFFF